ncbi:hypothetical protein PIIN_02113 [Serendipita indica DSM 11827]|uniref:Uncharacterized protein n=1 Tax=Serendipita indica (strain DSM 11827) TaxID=1109443 RepID=G4TA74_SERID|nr:hypothetical protein PIIN_02113 [Serendipita indica DSM 11827]
MGAQHYVGYARPSWNEERAMGKLGMCSCRRHESRYNGGREERYEESGIEWIMSVTGAVETWVLGTLNNRCGKYAELFHPRKPPNGHAHFLHLHDHSFAIPPSLLFSTCMTELVTSNNVIPSCREVNRALPRVNAVKSMQKE